jgi:O-antigen/teichoic acid export membrane protein
MGTAVSRSATAGRGIFSDRRQSLFASGGLTLAAAGWTTLLSLVSVPVMVDGLGVTAYGIYSVAFSVAALGSYLDLGLGWTTARFVAEADVVARARLAAIVTASALYHLVLGLAFAGVVLATTSLIAGSVLQLPAEQVAPAGMVLRMAAVSFVASSVMSVFISTLRGLQRFAAATFIMTAATTTSVGGAAVAAWLGQGLAGAALAQLLGAVGGLVAAAAACTGLINLSSPGALWRELRGMLGFSIWSYGTRLMQLLTQQADKILVARWLGPDALTFYAVPFNFAQRVSVFGGPAVTAIYPVAAAGQHDRDRFIRQYLSASRLLHVTTAALALALLLWGDRFLGAWIGAEMAARGSFAFRVLVAGFWLLSVGSFDGGCIEGWNRPRLTFLISLAAILGGLAVAAAATLVLADVAAAVPLGVATYGMVAGAGQMFAWQRLSRYPPVFQLRRVLLPLIEMTVIAVLASAWLRPVIDGRAATIVTMVSLMGALAAYGVWRTLSGDELRALGGRLASPLVRTT